MKIAGGIIILKPSMKGYGMKKYIKTFIIAFITCELVELLYNYFYDESIQQFIIGIITSFLIAVCISVGLNRINWFNIIERFKKKRRK